MNNYVHHEYSHEPLIYNGNPSYEKFRFWLQAQGIMSVNATRAGLTSLSLKCKNDIQIIPIVFTDPERQKHLGTAQNSSCKQTTDLHTGKNGLGFAFLSFLLLSHDVKEAWPLPSGILGDMTHEPASVHYSNIRFVLDSHLWCVDLSQCVRRADRSAQASHWSVWGDKWKKDRHRRRSVWERCCPGDCVGLPGWQAVAAVFSAGYGEKKDGSWEGTRKKLRLK